MAKRERGSRYNRKCDQAFPRERGEKRPKRTIAEKLRKYEGRGEAHEFVPALMHVIKRYVHGVPEADRNEVDRRVAHALDQLPNAKTLLGEAVTLHDQIPRELKRRAFSPRYIDLPLDQAVDAAEVRGIIDRAQRLRNVNVRTAGQQAALATAITQVDRDCCCFPQPPRPDPVPPTPPNQYELSFAKLYCVDESNPERFGSDEPYVVFGVITEDMAEAGTSAWAFHTPKYEDVDDGDTRPKSGDEHLRLYGFAAATPINSSMLVTALCFEHDLGDVSETTDAVRAALTAGAAKAAAAGGVVGWVLAGVAVIGIGVTYLIDLIGKDDQIGASAAFSLTETDADARTASVNPAMLEPLHFDGGDSDGIYDVYLKLTRA